MLYTSGERLVGRGIKLETVSENSPLTAAIVSLDHEALVTYDKNGDRQIANSEVSGSEKMDKMLKMLNEAFEAFDMDRDEKLNTKDWEVFRGMMASENGLLAIKLGGQGDQTSTAIRWRHQKPVPQVPSTLLYKGVLYMINDSGILLSFDPRLVT